jgi:hypothetical protein
MLTNCGKTVYNCVEKFAKNAWNKNVDKNNSVYKNQNFNMPKNNTQDFLPLLLTAKNSVFNLKKRGFCTFST